MTGGHGGSGVTGWEAVGAKGAGSVRGWCCPGKSCSWSTGTLRAQAGVQHHGAEPANTWTLLGRSCSAEDAAALSASSSQSEEEEVLILVGQLCQGFCHPPSCPAGEGAVLGRDPQLRHRATGTEHQACFGFPWAWWTITCNPRREAYPSMRLLASCPRGPCCCECGISASGAFLSLLN